ncbi:MAG: hypothetical protein QXF85_01905 [Candidatus Micrarchaeaceae archaeon]
MNEVHQLQGLKVVQKEFEIRIPFHNKTASDLDIDNIKRPDLRIDAISVKAPFTLVSVSPSLPIIISYMQSTEIVLRLRAPDVAYSGPLFLEMQAKTPDAVHISINRVKLSAAGKSFTVEDSARSMYINKGDTIKQDVQLLTILHEGDKVKTVRASAPFSVIKTEPQTPFEVASSNSFVVSIYLKSPDQNYSGPLEITFE